MLAQHGLELAAVRAAGVTLRSVDSPAVPREPLAWIGIDVFPVAEVEQLTLERDLGLRIRSSSADFASEDDRDGHEVKLRDPLAGDKENRSA